MGLNRILRRGKRFGKFKICAGVAMSIVMSFLQHELIIDNFAGGGGASTGLMGIER